MFLSVEMKLQQVWLVMMLGWIEIAAGIHHHRQIQVLVFGDWLVVNQCPGTELPTYWGGT